MGDIAQTHIGWDEDTNTWFARSYVGDRKIYQFTNYADVQEFAGTMKTGDQNALDALMEKCFTNPDSVDVMRLNLLDRSNTLFLLDNSVYVTPELTDTLDEFLAEAGQALWDALIAVLKATSAEDRRGAMYASKDPSSAPPITQMVRRELLFRKGITNPNRETIQSATPDFSMVWSNFSTVDFNLSWSCDVDLGNLITTPIAEPNQGYFLKAGKTQTLAWYQDFSSLFQEEVDGNVTIFPVGGAIIGIQIHVPVQVASIGTAPYYQVGQSDSTGAGFSWTGDYNSEGYKFPNLPANIGSIVVQPQASHSSLTMNIDVNPPNQ